MNDNAKEKRIGVVGIIIFSAETAVPLVNRVLSAYAHLVVGRMGVPYRERGISVISLIVEGDTDELGAMTGKLGQIAGVQTKSALSAAAK